MDISALRVRSRSVRLAGPFIIGLLLVVAGFSAYAVSSGRTGDSQRSGRAKVETQKGNMTIADLPELSFSILVENPRWKMDAPIPVKLRVYNAGQVPVQGLCSFQLVDLTKGGRDPFKERSNLWAPVIVQAEGAKPAAVPGPFSSVLNPGQTMDLEVDLNKLNWAKVIQSVWPRSTLSQTAEAGDEYELSFRLEVRTEGTRARAESNKVKVSIK